MMGLGFGGAQMIPWMIFPDTIDVAELATGKRPTGTYSGMMTLARKVSGAFGVGLVGWIINGAGYLENTTGDASVYIDQPDSAILAIKLVMGIAVAALIAFAFFASFRYKVTNRKLARIKYFNEKVEADLYDTLTEEEKEERRQLISQLAFRYNEEYDLNNVVYRNRKNAAEEEFLGEGAISAMGDIAEAESREEELSEEEAYGKSCGGDKDGGSDTQ